MKKKIAICAMIWLCSHSALIKQVNIAPDIQEYLTKHPDICAIYYVATPDKMLAKGISGCHNDKSKRIRPDAYQIQTTAITETMTAASIMLLHEQRKLNIHDHILKYIPVNYWPNGRPPYWAGKVTIHHLLRHTSGIASYRFQDQYKMDIHPKTDEITIKRKVLEYAVRNPIFYGVDQEYYHSSTDYFILGIIIENVSNQTLSNFFRENLFIPLGMNNTFLPSFIKRSNHPTKKEKKIESQVCLAFGDGGVITSVGDIHRWNVALHNMKIINKASYTQMTKTHWWLDTCCDPSGSVLDMFQKLGFKDCKDVAYGYGLHIIPLHSKAQVYCSSPGSCSGEEMWFLPDKNISIILLVNRDIPKLEKETLLETALLRNEIFSLVYK